MSNPGAPALLSSSHNMQGVTTLHARRNNMQGVTFCKFLFEKSADFEVQFLVLQEEIDGIFLSYIVVHGIPCVCEALAKSRHEFSQKSQSCKKLRLACSLFNMQGVTDCTRRCSVVTKKICLAAAQSTLQYRFVHLVRQDGSQRLTIGQHVVTILLDD